MSFPDFPQLEPGFSFGGLLRAAIPKGMPGYSALAEPPGATGEVRSDRYWMIEAIRESMRGVGITNPNPAVGCVLVDSQGREVSRGATQAYRGLHAERVAFNQAVDPNVLAGATAYVTLEPCSHTGNQPPCVDLFLSSGIRRVVVACADPNPLVDGKGISKLENSGKEVQVGLLGAEAAAWNFTFFAQQRLKRPVIVLKWAQTLDGQLADDSSTSQWISGPISRAYTHWLRQRYDAILVGASTVLKDYPRLDARDCALPLQSQPLPIIFDPRGICLEAEAAVQAKLCEKTFASDRSILFVTTPGALDRNRAAWIHKLKHVKILTLSSDNLIPEFVSLLGTSAVESVLGRPLQSVLVEGGPTTLNLFLEAGFADLIHLFIAPKLTGGRNNRIFSMKTLSESHQFQLVSTSRLGPDIVMELVSPELRFDTLVAAR